MDWVSVSARLLLAGVFGIAAAAKLLDQAGVRQTLRAFHVPRGLVPWAAIALPLAEALVCAALLIAPTARAGGVAGAALLTVFSVGIIGVLRRGERPECRCFGQAGSSPVGPVTLSRNAGLIALGIAAAAAPAPEIPSWLGKRSAAELAALGLGGAAALLGAVAIASRGARDALELELERVSRMARSGLEPGVPAPDVDLTDLSSGERASTLALVNGNRAVLVFVSSACPTCEELMPALGRWQRTFAGRLPILAIASGDIDAHRELAERHRLETVLVEHEEEAMRAFRVNVTPAAVAIGPDGAIDGETAEGLQAVESLVRLALQR